LHIVKCKIFTKVKGKDKLLDVKWDFFLNMHVVRKL
jgi:hypothetical protein